MKLLLLNGNTDAAITDRLVAAARAMCGHDVVGATARFGARYISTRAASAVAAHAVLDALAEHLPGGGFDAAIIACFGDPGLEAAREMFSVPVLGLADSSIRQGFALGPVVSLLTGGAAWVPMLEEFARPRTPPGARVRVRAIQPTGDMIAREPERALALLAEAARVEAQHGARCVVLGGAGLVGLAPRLRPLVPVPVLDCLEATLAELPLAKAAPVPMQGAPSTGLSVPLATLLAQGGGGP
ncbi:aspartate/glutamate racemase family protein [Roseococcus sp. DSY-14]|uniref:aspartate/glutamate racemase family protein n=1 Tax=Roseococcus sp. DSY-14 TaxID=3369650 RepID=UPI00387B8509